MEDKNLDWSQFDESEMDYSGGETNEYGEWSETMETIEGAQKTQLLDLVTSMSPSERKLMDRFVDASSKEGVKVGVEEMEVALGVFRKHNAEVVARGLTETGEGTQGSKPLAEQLRGATLQQTEKILEARGLYNDSSKHHFQGKAYPTSQGTSADRSRKIWNEAEIYKAPPRSMQRDPSINKGISNIPLPKLELNNHDKFRGFWNRNINKL